MKRFSQMIGRMVTVFLVIFIVSIVAVAAATVNMLWPNQPPTWEVSGGVIKTYFQNLLGRCDGNKVLIAINKATGIKECVNANSLISATNFGICPANNSYPKLSFTFGSSPVSSKIRLIWSSENTTQCSIPGIPTTATGWSVDVPANNNSYTLSCVGADGSSVSQTLNTTSIWAVVGSIAWPTVNPSGESTWGIFGNYLSNLGWEIGKCLSNEVIVGFEANGKPKCVVASSLMSASSCPGSSDPYINFTATPSNIAPWDPVTLAWQAGNLTSCTTSDAFAVNGSASWSALINPTTTSTYRITCSDDTGRQMQKSVSVTVTPPPIPGGWSSFGACQTSCTKTRTCTNPTPQNGWLTCQNDAQGGATVSCYGGGCQPSYYLAFRYQSMQNRYFLPINSNDLLSAQYVTSNPHRRDPTTKQGNLRNEWYIKLYVVDSNNNPIDPLLAFKRCAISISSEIFTYSSNSFYNGWSYPVSLWYAISADSSLNDGMSAEISLFDLKNGYDIGRPKDRNWNDLKYRNDYLNTNSQNVNNIFFPDVNIKSTYLLRCVYIDSDVPVSSLPQFSIHSITEQSSNLVKYMPEM